MRTHVIKRLLLAIPSLFVVAVFIFLAVRLMPGDALDAMFSQGPGATPEVVAAMRHDMGLDVPVYVQFVRWSAGVLHGDLGKSLLTGRPVMSRILDRLSVTLELTLFACIIAFAIALPVGIISAVRQDTWMDYVGRLFSIGLLAIPNFVLASLVVVVPSLLWHWSPPSGYVSWSQSTSGHLTQMLIAAATLGAHMSGLSMRMIRSSLLEVLREDYIRTARAKGLQETLVIWRHALKVCFIPVITVFGASIGFLLGGTVIIEAIFTLPGMGMLTLQSVTSRDYPQVQGLVLTFALTFVVMNLATDVVYGWLDPRIRYQ